ncbi:sulfite exporter TauE/SafE family protein [Enhydrobacter aerosaccus]|nr:sulfite exporter TauE/SafE family protein [Enhydrobacter aerosaccus]
MTPFLALALSLLMIGTAFLSGIFGMAGGLILIGVLLTLFPVPTAMVLHAVTQMASNGWRTVLWWRHVGWSSLVFYVAGCLISVGLWSITLYVPDKPMALLLLGLSPFVIRAMPERILPRRFGPLQVAITGLLSMALMLVTGVTGPLLDTMFLRSPLDRKRIIATKAACQVFGHGFKLFYFGALIEQAGEIPPWFLGVAVTSSIIGTSLGRFLLERLTDTQFRVWSNRLITALASYYVGYGLVLLVGIA